MNKILHYIFDPLCGWCYGAGGAVTALASTPGIALRLLPCGLFSGDGARTMDDEFAAYAWRNDQRIEQMTGQRFTEHYRSRVLADRRQVFDSGPATLALTAVALTAPRQEPAALRAIQEARYVDGEDITAADRLMVRLKTLGLDAAAQRIVEPDEELIAATRARTAAAQTLLRQVGARGVPTFILEKDGRRQWLASGAF